ncbi:MAG TPA: alpha-amylase family glycosyl hydrolase [Thermoleophilaceae bacterium]|nr:alpha-amylase family glycosyl hydrolase [Thermoleophilaceae bacterium]
MSWIERAVIYQVYPRSFQDASGDGIGDLAGIERRLGHIADLGAAALWLSPVYPSPGVDMGYDIADFRDVDPLFGDLASLDRLVASAHDQGLRVLLDLVPCHTSIHHPWFTEHPEYYVWADGDRPPNNWVANFGGPAWTLDPERGRWYLHSYYPEMPDLDWRNPDVVAAMQDVVRFWLDRGVDGFRLDAIQGLMKDPAMRDDPPAERPFGLPLPAEYGRLEHVHSTNSPDVGEAVAALRAAAGDAPLVGEVYLPAADRGPYLEHLDVAFAFELLHAPWDAAALAAAIEANAGGGAAWVLSNHDFPRVPTRVGEANARAAAVLLLTLPGPAFVYQGEELGQADAPGPGTRYDRHGRDSCRHPVQWEPDPRTGGFTDGEPWLAPVDAPRRNVRDQTGDPGSMLELYRALIALRADLDGDVSLLEAADGVVAFRRGRHTVAVNTSSAPAPMPARGPAVVSTHPGEGDAATLVSHEARVVG